VRVGEGGAGEFRRFDEGVQDAAVVAVQAFDEVFDLSVFASERFKGFFAIEETLNFEVLHNSRNSNASSCVLKRLLNSAFTSFFEPSSLVTAKTAFKR